MSCHYIYDLHTTLLQHQAPLSFFPSRMALRKILAKRLFNGSKELSPLSTLENSPFWSSSAHYSPNPANISLDSDETSFFRKFLQQRGLNQSTRLPEFLSVPVGEKLREKLRSINIGLGERIQIDGLELSPLEESISVKDARKIMRSSQLEKVRSTLRQIPMNSISYSEFVQVCCDGCSGNREQGGEFANKLDESGNVIVLGNVVFLRPEQVAKSIEKIISESIAIPNDPRKEELQRMEKQKAIIDMKAEGQVRRELFCGLGFLVVQTLGFMRLTFWELTWDVMEPICFFFTSLHFALAYGFFLRTSKEPSFQGYFQRRFKVKQQKLMKTHNFDVHKYNQLCKAFYPNFNNLPNSGHFQASQHAEGVLGPMH